MSEEKKESVFTDRYVKPHRKIARDVTAKDLKRVIEEAHVLYNLCFCYHGRYQSAFAVAHPQIDDKDPLRLFVTANKEIIINPVVTNHTRTPVKSLEGCTTFAEVPQIMVERFNKCEVEFSTLTNGGELSERKNKSLTGLESKVFQHEMDHLSGKYVYDDSLRSN